MWTKRDTYGTVVAMTVLAGCLLGLSFTTASAQWTGSQIGGMTIWTGPQGKSVTCSQIGNMTICN